MLQRQISYEKLVKAVNDIKGEASAALLDSVTDVILSSQKHLMPSNLIKEAVEERFGS